MLLTKKKKKSNLIVYYSWALLNKNNTETKKIKK